MAHAQSDSLPVLRLDAVRRDHVEGLLARLGLSLQVVPDQEDIPGSYWGDEEAGLVEDRLLARRDTPLHSVLHESCHYVCMDTARRRGLDTDAGGDYEEENAVCYLQIVLADYLPGLDRTRMMRDMDAWGYSFRLGSARDWFESDAEDARDFLASHGLIDGEGQPTWKLRTS